MSNASKTSRRDCLTTTTNEGRIELTEEELSRVAGGRKAGGRPVEYLKIKFQDILISGY
jgi:hypothetical protein